MLTVVRQRVDVHTRQLIFEHGHVRLDRVLCSRDIVRQFGLLKFVVEQLVRMQGLFRVVDERFQFLDTTMNEGVDERERVQRAILPVGNRANANDCTGMFR